MPDFVSQQSYSVGFVSVDLDFYSSTQKALRLFTSALILPHTPVYFDDTCLPCCHTFAGELLAIRGFNCQNSKVKIDYWRGVKAHIAFPDSSWLDRMYMAHLL